MNRMILVLLVTLLLNFGHAFAQKWETQRAPGLSQAAPAIWFSAVDANVCWGIKVSLGDDSRQTPQIIRTTNGGSSWDTVAVPGGASGLEGINITALDANTAWALMWDRSGATSGGVFKTTDAGRGWTRDSTIFPVPGKAPEGMHFFDSKNGVVWGYIRDGYWEIYTTTDGGAHWIRVPYENIPIPQSGDNALDGEQIASIGNTLWFCTFLRSVYKTTDRGMTWSVARNVLGSDGVGLEVAFKDTMNGLACSPFNNTGGNRIHKTTDGGATWTSIPSGSIPATPSAIWIAYDPVSHVYVMTSHHFVEFATPTNPGSAYSTDDGSSWKQIDALPHGPPVFTASGAGWSNGANDSVYKWISPIPTAGLQLWLRADAGVDTLNGKVSRWHDQSGNGNDAIQTGASRQPLLMAGALNGNPVIRFDGVNDKLGFTGSILMTQFSLFLVINNHAGDPNNDGNVLTFGANRDFDHQWFMGMWSQFGPDSIGMATGYTNAIYAMLPHLGDHDQWRNLSIVTTGSIWNTTLRWDGKSAHMSPVGADYAISVPMGDATGSGGGIGGADGVPAGTLLAKCDVAEILAYNVALSDSVRKSIESYLATKYGLTPVTGISAHQKGNLPERYVLEQNYPNPFNPSTTIRYALPNRSHVTLMVFNTLGQKVGELVNADIDAGSHELQFNAANLASGVYFYQIQAGEFVQARSLLLLK